MVSQPKLEEAQCAYKEAVHMLNWKLNRVLYGQPNLEEARGACTVCYTNAELAVKLSALWSARARATSSFIILRSEGASTV